MNGSHLKKLGIFAGGVLFGTAGLKVLGSKDAKKLYVNCLAAGLRARDCARDGGKPSSGRRGYPG